jgi:ribonuclease BN (tRNA processing enzyme)
MAYTLVRSDLLARGLAACHRLDGAPVSLADEATNDLKRYHHAPGSPSAGKDKSYSLRFDTPGRSVVFSGDTGPSEALKRLAADADVLVCEVLDLEATMKEVETTMKLPPAMVPALRRHMAEQHLSPEQVGQLAQKARVKMVVLTHFSPGLDGETDVSRYVDGVRKHFKGPVIAGRDLLEL